MEEQPQNIATGADTGTNTKIIPTVAIILLVLGASYIFYEKYSPSNDGSGVVMVKNTPVVNGVLRVPEGFPQDIPLDGEKIIESATTQYPDQDTQQLSVSYQSSGTIAQKYAEYRAYLNQAGYSVTEGETNSLTRSIAGTKEDTVLSVAISNVDGKTLVQLSYLLK